MQFGKVTRVAEGYADVAFDGGTRSCSTALLDVAVGDEVVAHMGVLMQKRQPVDEAGEIVEGIQNVMHEIREADEIG